MKGEVAEGGRTYFLANLAARRKIKLPMPITDEKPPAEGKDLNISRRTTKSVGEGKKKPQIRKCRAVIGQREI